MDKQNLVFTGLGTLTLAIDTTGTYFIEGHTSVPTITDGSGATSAVVTTVNQNGSPKYVGLAGAEGFRTQLLCTAGDTLTVVFTSAAAVDQPLNVIKSNISLGQGV